MSIWIRNTEGRRDATLTMAFVGFVVVLVRFLFSGFTIGPLQLGQVDASVIAAILTPTLGSYVARRYTDRRHSQPADEAAPSTREPE